MAKKPPSPPAHPVNPGQRNSPGPAGAQPGESKVQQALNALAACAESLVESRPGAPDRDTCRVQLAEAKRLIASLDDEPAETSGEPAEGSKAASSGSPIVPDVPIAPSGPPKARAPVRRARG